MAMNDQAVITPTEGLVLTAEVGTEPPTSLDGLEDTPPDGYDSLGNTSIDDLPTFTIDGGDTEIKGTWQNQNFRVVQTKAATPMFKITALQFDNDILAMYFGTDNDSTQAGRFDIHSIGTGYVEKALLIVFTDGQTHVAFWSPKASFTRDDDPNVANDDFMGFPIRATLLNVSGQPLLAAMAPWLGTAAVQASTFSSPSSPGTTSSTTTTSSSGSGTTTASAA